MGGNCTGTCDWGRETIGVLEGGSKMENAEHREELLKRLRKLADRPVNDAVRLAFLTPETVEQVKELDLSGLVELKRTDKSVEVKFVDQMKVLEMMRELMEQDGGNSAEEFFRALGERTGAEAE